VGPSMIAACGESVAALVTQDVTSHIEDMPEASLLEANFDATACNLFLCKGLQFADNVDNVQTFEPGQVVNMLADIPIPHEGPMNVSIIDTKTNTAIGDPLISCKQKPPFSQECLTSRIHQFLLETYSNLLILLTSIK
jgi:hypothetical protein